MNHTSLQFLTWLVMGAAVALPRAGEAAHAILRKIEEESQSLSGSPSALVPDFRTLFTAAATLFLTFLTSPSLSAALCDLLLLLLYCFCCAEE